MSDTAQVTFTAGSGVRRYDVSRQQQLVIGRSTRADLYVNSPRLSRLHCAVRLGDEGLLLEDLRSANGTFVNGQRIQQAILRPGDILQVGGVAIRVDFDGPTKELDLSCERCGRPISMARVDGSQVIEIGAHLLCPECGAADQEESLSQTEQYLVDVLADEGFLVEGKLALSTPTIPVFRARRTDLDTLVAIKALPLVSGVSDKRVKRFETEARAAAKVNHPAVIEIYDIRQADKVLYLLMELVEGELLLDAVNSRGPLPMQTALRVGLLIARALHKAHQEGVIHRDLKPAGVMLTGDGRPKLADFGLAKDLWSITSRLTGPDETLGTVRYMPPEQVKNARNADARADIYSLGATLYHVMTGAPPYANKNELDLMSQVLAGTLPAFDPTQADLPGEVSQVLGKAMARDPAERYQSAGDMEQALGEAVVSLMGLKGFRSDPELLLSMPPQAGLDETTWQAIPAPKPGGLSGYFDQEELTAFLRMVAHNQRSGLLSIQSQELSGHVAIVDGRIRNAVTNRGQRGRDAARALATLANGQFEFNPELPTGFASEVDLDLEGLILDAARDLDERRETRRHRRPDLHP